MGIIKNTLVCYSKICKDNNKRDYFLLDKEDKIHNFFYRMSKKYPVLFEKISFNRKGNCHKSSEIEKEWENLMRQEVIIPYWKKRNNHFYEPSICLYYLYNKVKNRGVYDKIAAEFYKKFDPTLS